MSAARTTPTGSLEKDFIRVREVLVSVPWGSWIKNDMPLELRRKFFIFSRSEERLRRHLEMLKAFGFNSIQLQINPCVAYWVGADVQASRRCIFFLARTARELGLSVSTFVWGAAVGDPAPAGGGVLQEQNCTELNWGKPEERARLEAWYRDQAEFAPEADRVITHWLDAGFPQPGGIDTVVEMHNIILAIYRERNPGIRGALSTWFMDDFGGKRYPGLESEAKLASHPALDRNTNIALGRYNHGCDGTGGGETSGDEYYRVSGQTLDAIAAAGRQTGIWGWYTADLEVLPALHVRTDVLQNYFRGLPPQTRTELAWHSVEDCFTGLNMQNLYVAGKLMQDPSLDAQALLDEFTRGLVGESNAPAVAATLRAVEQARTRSLCYSTRILTAQEPPVSEQGRTALPVRWLDDTARAVDDALRGLATVELAPGFTPAWPVTMEPAEYLQELSAHLEAIKQMLAFLKGVREVERMRTGGQPAAKIEAAINALPRVEYDRRHTAGLEAELYRQKLAALKKDRA